MICLVVLWPQWCSACILVSTSDPPPLCSSALQWKLPIKQRTTQTTAACCQSHHSCGLPEPSRLGKHKPSGPWAISSDLHPCCSPSRLDWTLPNSETMLLPARKMCLCSPAQQPLPWSAQTQDFVESVPPWLCGIILTSSITYSSLPSPPSFLQFGILTMNLPQGSPRGLCLFCGSRRINIPPPQ